MRPLKDSFLRIFFSDFKKIDILVKKITGKILSSYVSKASSIKNIVHFIFLLLQNVAIPCFRQQELLSVSN